MKGWQVDDQDVATNSASWLRKLEVNQQPTLQHFQKVTSWAASSASGNWVEAAASQCFPAQESNGMQSGQIDLLMMREKLASRKSMKKQLTSTKIWCYLPIHSTPFSKKPLLPVPLRLKQNALCKTAKQTTFWDWDPQTCCLKKSAVSVVDCKAWRTVFSSLGQTFMQVLIHLKPPRNKGRDPYWHWTS